MTTEPASPVAVGFIDGQNIFNQAKRLFGRRQPDFDPVALHQEVSKMAGFVPGEVRFYTGVPTANRQPHWHRFWRNKTLAMKRAGVIVTTRPLRYRQRRLYDEDGELEVITQAEEKGIDIRIALDLVRMARRGEMDAGIIYSQDQDLNEVVSEIEAISQIQGREIALASAFPSTPDNDFDRGIDRTRWLRIDQATYARCIDLTDYRQG